VVEGFDEVQWLIIDDGSTDRTIEVARSHGVEHVVRLPNHKGLSSAFQAGLDAALKLGADVIVNTDADNQYEGADIHRLVAPILGGTADLVVGDRGVTGNQHFSAGTRLLQRLGSWVVRQASSTRVPDATSGFRAYNREAALQVQVVSRFTYTLETLIQAGKLLVAVEHVPVRTHPRTRESRLFPSKAAYVRRNALSIFRVYSQHQPLKVFWGGALVMGLAALALFVRFVVIFAEHPSTAGRGHIQSLIAGAVLFIGAMLLGALGVIGDLLDAQRTISQRTFERVRRIELQLGIEPSYYEPALTPEASTPGRTARNGRSPDRETLEV
jgi:glycosyltransferase involved in cell wall biosynthesis